MCITTCRQYCFGPLGLISTVLMIGWYQLYLCGTCITMYFWKALIRDGECSKVCMYRQWNLDITDLSIFLTKSSIQWAIVFTSHVIVLFILHQWWCSMYMLCFNLILVLICFCFKLIIIHFHSQKQKEIKFKPRIKLNHNIHLQLCVTANASTNRDVRIKR